MDTRTVPPSVREVAIIVKEPLVHTRRDLRGSEAFTLSTSARHEW